MKLENSMKIPDIGFEQLPLDELKRRVRYNVEKMKWETFAQLAHHLEPNKRYELAYIVERKEEIDEPATTYKIKIYFDECPLRFVERIGKVVRFIWKNMKMIWIGGMG